MSPLGRKLVEDDDNLLRLPGDNSYKNDDECIQNQNDSILLVKLFGLFQWESFTFI